MNGAAAPGLVPGFRQLSAADRTAACLVALAHLPGLGPATLRRCHLEHGAEESWFDIVAGKHRRVLPVTEQLARMRPEATERLLTAARERDVVADLARQDRPGWQLHVFGTRTYPERLRCDPEAPALLFTCGRLELLAEPTVAMVGTRNATLAGRQLAETMAADLADAGVVVVSGLALGIDGAAHRGAIGRGSPAPHGTDVGPGGTTGTDPGTGRNGRVPAVGVVASGLDIAYPRRHADLHVTLAERGLLMSETPAGVRPDAWRFPARNRIIAGLSDAVVVVESRVTGGSMHTVEEALVRDVPVLAVPGHPSAPASAGTNALLFDGAGMARDASDVLLALGRAPGPGSRDSTGAQPTLPLRSPAEEAVLDALGTSPASLTELVVGTGRTVEEVAHALATLELDALVRRTGAWYEAAAAQGEQP